MRNKWFRRIRWFIELFTPGFTMYNKAGIEARVRRDGSWSIPPSEYGKIIDLRLKERAHLEAMWRAEREAADKDQARE